MIRPATLDDATAIAAIHVRSWQAIYRGQMSDELLDNLSVVGRAADWTEIIGSGAEQVAVFQLFGSVAGFVCFGPSLDRGACLSTGELGALYIEPGSWRRGIGSQLMDWTKRTALARGWTNLTLWVMRSNAQARAFYEAAGWSRDGAVKRTYLGGSTIELVRYEWVRAAVPTDMRGEGDAGALADRTTL